MRRREFIAFASACVTWPFAALAQQAERTHGIGVLSPSCLPSLPGIAFLEEVKQHRFVLLSKCSVFEDNYEKGLQYARELVDNQFDIIIAYGDVAIRAAQQATKTIPILAMADDLMGSGLVQSLARPDGNTTGVSILATELDGKRRTPDRGGARAASDGGPC
jgi:ABC-type uncharacterized transport system substrate-binding protein